MMTAKLQIQADAQGKVELPAGVTLGDGQFLLSEIQAPAGYTKTDSVYLISLARVYDGSSGSTSRNDTICIFDDATANDCLGALPPTDLSPGRTLQGASTTRYYQIDLSSFVDLANVKNYNVVLDKVDATTQGWHLAGARYELYEIQGYNRGDQGANANPSTNGTFTSKTLLNSGDTNSSGALPFLEAYSFNTSKDYMLIETIAPNGHKIPTTNPSYLEEERHGWKQCGQWYSSGVAL